MYQKRVVGIRLVLAAKDTPAGVAVKERVESSNAEDKASGEGLTATGSWRMSAVGKGRLFSRSTNPLIGSTGLAETPFKYIQSHYRP
jgi:hypothetical protein